MIIFDIFACRMFQWGVRQSAETENHMVSVERVGYRVMKKVVYVYLHMYM